MMTIIWECKCKASYFIGSFNIGVKEIKCPECLDTFKLDAKEEKPSANLKRVN